MVLSEEEEAAALLDLGRQRQAEALRQALVKVLLAVLPVTADARALSVDHGRRLLAAELLKAIETPESADGRHDIASLVHRPARPVEYGNASRRRVPDRSPDDIAAGERAEPSRPERSGRLSGHRRRSEANSA